MATFLNSLPRTLRTILRRLLFVLETPLMYLFGRDIFISYARADAAEYARELAIGVRDRVPKFSFFLDQWASLSGTTLPLSLRLALRWSQMLVFVGTPNAIGSAHVRMELEAFFNRKGRFVPIDVGGALDQAMRNDKLLAAVCGPGPIREESEDVANGTPSKDVVTRIVDAATFTRQDQRLHRAVIASTLGVLAIITAGYFISRTIVDDAQAQASTAKDEAAAATEQRQKALRDMGAASFAAAMAQSDQLLARLLANEARKEKEIAVKLRAEAERLRDQARAEARRQGEIATSRQRASESELTLRQTPVRLPHSVSLAVESMQRAHAAGIRSLQADSALRTSLSLLPRSLGSARAVEAKITATALSPDAKHIAILSTSGLAGQPLSLRIINANDGRQIAELAVPQGSFIALSNDTRRVAISNGRVVQTREISGSGSWQFTIQNEDDSVTGLALSPDGTHLALMMRNADAEEGQGFAEVWQVETPTRGDRLEIEDRLIMKSIAFSANGKLLVIGGSGEGRSGRAVLFNLWRRDYNTEPATYRVQPRDQELSQEGAIEAIAVGPDERFLATANNEMVMVWKETGYSYRQIARIPTQRPINNLAFNSDGKRLQVLSSGACDTPRDDCSRKFWETWETSGYSETVIAPHSMTIQSLAFQPGDELVTTISDVISDDEDRVRVFKASDGEEFKTANMRLGDARNVSGDFATNDVRYFVTRNVNSVWSVWDLRLRTNIPITFTGIEEDTVGKPSLSPDANLLAFTGRRTGDQLPSVLIYKREGSSYVQIRSFPLPSHVCDLAISADRNYTAAACYEQGLQVFDVIAGTEMKLPEINKLREIQSFQFAPISKILAVVWREGTRQKLAAWHLPGGQEIKTLDTSIVLSFSFSPASDYLVASTHDDDIKLLDLRSGKVIDIPANGRINLVTFNPDGRLLATADAEGLVRVIELSSRDDLIHLPHQYAVDKIAFSKNGEYLATATKTDNEDRTKPDEAYQLHVWRLRPKELIKEACQRLPRFGEESLYCAP